MLMHIMHTVTGDACCHGDNESFTPMKLVKTACSSRTLHAKGALISIIANDINNEHDDLFLFF